MVAVRADVHESGLATAEVKHAQWFAENLVAFWTVDQHCVFLAIHCLNLNVVADGLAFDVFDFRCTAFASSPEIQNQSHSAQGGWNGQTNVDEPFKTPVRQCPTETELKPIVVKVAVNDAVKLIHQKSHENRADNPHQDDYAHEPRTFKQGTHVHVLNPNKT
jgi:hypothetical protein